MPSSAAAARIVGWTRPANSRCGGDASETGSQLADTRWTIATVDGRAVRGERPATMNFAGDRIEGRICNSYGGSYRFARGTLTASQVISTKMACFGDIMRVETAVFRALRTPLKVHSGNNPDTLVLASGRTSITLRRAR